MADTPDKTIGQLEELAEISDTSLLPVQQSGTAYHTTGAAWKQWVRDAIASLVALVEAKSDQASDDATRAETAAASTAADRTAIEGMGISSTVLEAGATPTLSKQQGAGGVWTLEFGLAPGAVGPRGATGPQGLQGVQGIQGPPGGNAATVEAASGLFSFAINPQGHLIMTYSGAETNPEAWYIDTDTTSPTYGHLFYDPDLE